MYDGKQVVTVKNGFKKSDLYNIGIEMSERKGTGNYEKERTKFNVEYVSINESNLYKEVKETLKRRNIEYNDRPTTNLLCGITFTSGIEFFEALGMKLKNTDRTYKTGNKEGQVVRIPDIKKQDDIPQAVSYYFDSCMDFLKDFVGEENIILAQIHYDEDTPHLQAYFLPIVKEVKRKCYEKDKDGNIVKEEYVKKNGEVAYKFKLLRDENGKMIYKKEKGLFLNNDQFWKDKGSQLSYAKLQDDFNKFINARGFKLDRGEIGANKEHTTKLEYQVKELQAELEALNKEKDYSINEIENNKQALKNAIKSKDKDILNPKKNVVGYNSKDVSEIIDYSKNLEQINIIQESEIINKDNTIKKLQTENDKFKNNEEIKKRDNLIKEQKDTIKEQKKEINRLKNLVNVLNNNIEHLKEKIKEEIEKWTNKFSKLCSAIDKLLGKEHSEYLDDYEDLADSINYGYYNNDEYDYDIDNDKDDYDMTL